VKSDGGVKSGTDTLYKLSLHISLYVVYFNAYHNCFYATYKFYFYNGVYLTYQYTGYGLFPLEILILPIPFAIFDIKVSILALFPLNV
jgi:hypothetical protein